MSSKILKKSQSARSVKKTESEENRDSLPEMSRLPSEVRSRDSADELSPERERRDEEIEPEETSLNLKVKEMLQTIATLMKNLKTIETDLKNVRILYKKEMKENSKKTKQKKVRKVGNTEPHGFVKEVRISDELAGFLKLPKGSLMARPKVTKAISMYVRENNLANPENKTIFKADSDLQKILGEPRLLINKKKPELGYGYSYFNLQSLLVEHFIKEKAEPTIPKKVPVA